MTSSLRPWLSSTSSTDESPERTLRTATGRYSETFSVQALLDGRPIARTAADAVDVLLNSDLAYLQLGPYLVTKHAPTYQGSSQYPPLDQG